MLGCGVRFGIIDQLELIVALLELGPPRLDGRTDCPAALFLGARRVHLVPREPGHRLDEASRRRRMLTHDVQRPLDDRVAEAPLLGAQLRESQRWVAHFAPASDDASQSECGHPCTAWISRIQCSAGRPGRGRAGRARRDARGADSTAQPRRVGRGRMPARVPYSSACAMPASYDCAALGWESLASAALV